MENWLNRWIPVTIGLGAWAGWCWSDTRFGPLVGFAVALSAVLVVAELIDSH